MKALTIGGAMIDTIAIIANDRIERMTMLNADNSFLLLEEGRKTEAAEISTHVGGGAVNAAVALARIGLDVSTLVKLGKDQRAETVLSHLLQEGVSTRWALRDGRAPTGASVLVSSHDRNAAIFTFRGANTLLEEADLRDEAFAVDAVYVSSLSNESADTFPAIIAKAKAQGALVATNPRVRQLSSRTTAFQEALARIDILAVNRSEADVLVPGLVARFGEGGGTLPLAPGETPPRLLARGFVGGGHDMTLPAFFAALRQMGPRYVIVTDGRHGAFLGTQRRHPFLSRGGGQGDRNGGRRRCLQRHVHRLYRARSQAGGRHAGGRHQRRLGRRPCRHADGSAVAGGHRQRARRAARQAARAHMVALAVQAQ